jgi:hypothetical protein
MDECLEDDDDEEHHRVLFSCFGAQHEGLPVPAGSVTRDAERVLKPDPAQRTAGSVKTVTRGVPDPVRLYGRSITR